MPTGITTCLEEFGGMHLPTRNFDGVMRCWYCNKVVKGVRLPDLTLPSGWVKVRRVPKKELRHGRS